MYAPLHAWTTRKEAMDTDRLEREERLFLGLIAGLCQHEPRDEWLEVMPAKFGS